MTDQTLPLPDHPQPAHGRVVGTAKGYTPPAGPAPKVRRPRRAPRPAPLLREPLPASPRPPSGEPHEPDRTSTSNESGPRTAGLRPRLAPRITAGIVAALALWAVWATWDTFVVSPVGQRADQLALDGAARGQGVLWELAEPVLGVVSNTFIGLGLAAAVVLALARGRWWLAAQVAILVAGSNLTTQVLKHAVLDRPALLDVPRADINTLPSGHTTVAASIAAGLLIAVPRRWRPVVAVAGAVYTGATGVSTLVGQWHRPSDVVAAILVVLAWGAGVCLLSSSSSLDAPQDGRDRGTSGAAGLLLLGAVGTGALAVGALGSVRGDGWGLPLGGDLTAYMGGMLGVVAVTLASFALLLLVRQSTARP
ncbi:phosphatase PAP2 family protein [Promicromonospora iranensis]|uniref:Membrane-associated phospholipid phosphatase n=1 Tax=Promicromonospora iranensis TaxID=1105144 RepID=A0ABU2CNJ2_9MICO|nr:phosphatase PAP2 family protein [Promicromonospora iranensis]MDR7382913.1 membrane-associated phospholipid phosphatase [Promicromonospora iranensis]